MHAAYYMLLVTLISWY